MSSQQLEEKIDELLQGVFNSGRMADWKIHETKSDEISPWVGREQAKQALLALIAEERLEAQTEQIMQGFLDYSEYCNDDESVLIAVRDSQLQALTSKETSL